MSLSNVRPYFRARMKSLGFTEWPDGFSSDNIPSTILDGSFHLESGTIDADPTNQRTSTFTYPVTVRLFRKGFRDVGLKIDAVDQDLETILADILKESNRLNVGNQIISIEASSFDKIQLDATNDNAIILEMVFTAKVILCFE